MGVVIIVVFALPYIAMTEPPAPWWVHCLVQVVVPAVFAVASLFCVRGYTVKGRELWVQRLFWQTRVPLQGLKKAHVDSTAMKGSFKTAGNGGFLAFSGWFRSKKLGNFRAYVTDPDRCVVMEFQKRKIVVSPDDPEAYVEALGFELDSKLNSH